MKLDFRDVLVFGGIGLMTGGIYLIFGLGAGLLVAGVGFYILGLLAKP